MQQLFTPWRYSYISTSADDSGCFLCAAARCPADPDGLVVYTTRHHLVMLNLHPYANGHLMVAPLEHFTSPHESGPEAQAELWPLALRSQRILTEAYRPHGFNLGMNLGAPAGAGVPGPLPFPYRSAVGGGYQLHDRPG